MEAVCCCAPRVSEQLTFLSHNRDRTGLTAEQLSIWHDWSNLFFPSYRNHAPFSACAELFGVPLIAASLGLAVSMKHRWKVFISSGGRHRQSPPHQKCVKRYVWKTRLSHTLPSLVSDFHTSNINSGW